LQYKEKRTVELETFMSCLVDPALLESWMRARSVSRGLPQPVREGGGLRLESGLPHETRRYLFARATQTLRDIAESVHEPRIFLKLCDTPAVLRNFAPPRWQIPAPNFVMTCDDAVMPRSDATKLPPGYRLELKTESAVTSAFILAPDGVTAASGYAAEYAGVFIYDRIVANEAHRRKGLGTALMTALASARTSVTARQILVATAAGRELYRGLGWTDYAPYTTAVIPEETGTGV
jgi:hypothetical protein